MELSIPLYLIKIFQNEDILIYAQCLIRTIIINSLKYTIYFIRYSKAFKNVNNFSVAILLN